MPEKFSNSTERVFKDKSPIEYPVLPIDQYRENIIENVRQNQTVIISGETGSGKTTRIADYLLSEFPHAKIAITEPRRLATQSISQYVAQRRGTEVGSEIGYQIRFEDKTNPDSKVIFMTDGIILRKLQKDPLLEEYDIVVVDEAHERSLNIDFTLGLLKQAQLLRKQRGGKELKIIITSATLEQKKFTDYFGQPPMVEIPGRTHPVEIVYEKEKVDDYALMAAEKVKEIIDMTHSGDILIFVPGEREIFETINKISKLELKEAEIMPLFGRMPIDEQNKIFEKIEKRKIIVATNIAETSVTIDGIAFVVDSGLIKQKQFDHQSGLERLVTQKHSQGGCKQRAGRAGRTAPGKCFRLYTEDDYASRQSFSKPEIARLNLDHVVLAMKKIGINNIESFDFIDPIDKVAISHALEALKVLGALNEKEEITPIGEKMADLPVKPESSRMLIEAAKYGVVESFCTIVAMIEGKSIFLRPADKQTEADEAQKQFKTSGSDFLTLLEVYHQWTEVDFDENWARDHFLNLKQLQEVELIRQQLIIELGRLGIAGEDFLMDHEDKTDAIEKVIIAGLCQNLMVNSGGWGYQRTNNPDYCQEIFIHPSSAAFNSVSYVIIGFRIVKTTRNFARLCHPVYLESVFEVAPHLFQEKGRSYFYDDYYDNVKEKITYSLQESREDEDEDDEEDEEDEVKEWDAAELVIENDINNPHIETLEFIRALTEGSVDWSVVEHNQKIIEQLTALRVRSGGKITIPDLKSWYADKARGLTNKKSARGKIKKLKLNFDNYCSFEQKEEIEVLYPETIRAQNDVLKVSYQYNEKTDDFTATIDIPMNILLDLDETDFPEIGKSGRPIIYYVSKREMHKTLEKLKISIDTRRLNKEWSKFLNTKNKEKKDITKREIEVMSTMTDIGVESVVYAKDHRNNNLLAYPGLELFYNYNQQFWFGRIRYFQTQEKANQSIVKAKNKIKQANPLS